MGFLNALNPEKEKKNFLINLKNEFNSKDVPLFARNNWKNSFFIGSQKQVESFFGSWKNKKKIPN